MKQYRIETIHGRHLVRGGVLPNKMLKKGQTWAAADGSNHAVVIDGIEKNYVQYTSITSGTYHEMQASSFQTRYCLVVPEPVVPIELG